MKHCLKCGFEMQDGDVFCPACGASQTPAVGQNVQPEVAGTKKMINIFGLIGLIAGILAIAFVWIQTGVCIGLAAVGIVFSVIGMCTRKKFRFRALAILGLICSIIALAIVFTLALIIILVVKSIQ